MAGVTQVIPDPLLVVALDAAEVAVTRRFGIYRVLARPDADLY